MRELEISSADKVETRAKYPTCLQNRIVDICQNDALFEKDVPRDLVKF